MIIYTDIEWETAEYEGGHDMFRAISLTDEGQNDLVQCLAPGRRFADLYELRITLAALLEIPVDDIILDGV